MPKFTGRQWEIWEDTDGQVDIMVAGVGTGGTITGVAEVIKPRKPEFQASQSNPLTAQFCLGTSVHTKPGHWCWVYSQVLKVDLIDEVIVSDEDAIAYGRRLAREEGLLSGISTGCGVVQRFVCSASGKRGALDCTDSACF